MEIFILESDWLAPYHPIPNSNSSKSLHLLTTKVPEAPLYPIPKSGGQPQSMNKSTLKEPGVSLPILTLITTQLPPASPRQT